MTSFRAGMLSVVFAVMPAEPTAQHPQLPFSVEARSTQPRQLASQIERVVGIRERPGSCRSWLVDLLTRADDRLVLVSSAAGDNTRPITVSVIPGQDTIVAVRCEGRPGYSLHGPFTWRSSERVVWLDFRPSRTVRISTASALSAPPRFSLLFEREGASHSWPWCRPLTRVRYECVGVPFDASAVAVAGGTAAVEWALVPPARLSVQTVATHRADWGRLLRLADVGGRTRTDLVVRAWRHAGSMSSSRTRVRLTADETVRVYPLGPLAVWVTGQRPGRDRFIEVKGPDVTTVRIDVERIRHAHPSHPLLVYLRPDLSQAGVVLDDLDRPQAGALVSVFELLPRKRDPGADEFNESSPRRWLAEVVAGVDGTFTVPGLAAGTYEFVAVHETGGRATEVRRVDGARLILRLARTPRVKGRVLVEQLPAAGVPIKVVPDADEFLETDDPVKLMSPPGHTDRDGRFELALPAEGSGEVIVGGNGLAKSRFRFVVVDDPASIEDLGDIHLPAPVSVGVRLDAPGCVLTAGGPLGSLGLEQIRAVFDPGSATYRLRIPEPGFWWLEADCAGESRNVAPPVMQIGDDSMPGVIDATLVPSAPP